MTTTVSYDGMNFLFPTVGRPCANGLTAEHDAGRFYELDLLEDSVRHCQGLVVDVGANLGNHTVFWAGVCRARVISIEPDETLCGLLREALTLNTGRINPLTLVYPVVCGEGTPVRSIPHPVAPEQTAGNRCFVPDPYGDIPTSRLSDLLPLGGVSLLKIDVEGMEANVIDGAYQLLHRSRPVVYVEALDHASFDDIETRLRMLRYRMVTAFGKTYKWIPNDAT